MPDLTLICPDCGGAIRHECPTQPGVILAQGDDAMSAQGGAIPAWNGEVAREVLDLELRTKDGRAAYNQAYPAEFLVFWGIYPRHRDKRKALKAWRNAIRRATQSEINAGAMRYRNDPNRKEEFTKYAEGWLNGDGWLDEPLPERLAPGILPAIGLPESQEDIDAKIATYLGGET